MGERQEPIIKYTIVLGRRHHTVSYLFFSFHSEMMSLIRSCRESGLMIKQQYADRYIYKHNKCINNIFLLFDAYGIALTRQQDDKRTSFFHQKISLYIVEYNHCLSLLFFLLSVAESTAAGGIKMMIPSPTTFCYSMLSNCSLICTYKI